MLHDPLPLEHGIRLPLTTTFSKPRASLNQLQHLYLLHWHLKFTNIEIGALASLDRRDQCLISLAEAKYAVAKAEHALAHCRLQEIMELHRLQCIREELAQTRTGSIQAETPLCR